MTSLTGNHVSGTTTLTTSNLSSSNCNNPQTSSNVNQSQSRIQSIVHVHQPPQSVLAKQIVNKVQNPPPLAGGWLIGESANGTLITTNEQQVFQNILNNNTNSNNLCLNSGSSAGGTVVYSGNCISSTSESVANVSSITSANSCSSNTKYYGNLATTSTGELLANGHGPRKEVCTITILMEFVILFGLNCLFSYQHYRKGIRSQWMLTQIEYHL